MSKLPDPTANWSLRTRVAVAAAVTAVVGAAVAFILVSTAGGGAGAIATSSGGAGGSSTTTAAPMSYAPVQPAAATPTRTKTEPAPTSRADRSSNGGGASGGQLAMPLPASQLDQAGKVAASWLSGVMTIGFDDDFSARARKLTDYLAVRDDQALQLWLMPTPASVEDMKKHRSVSVATAAVIGAQSVTPSSVVWKVKVTVTTEKLQKKPETTSGFYLVSVVTSGKGDSWKISAMTGAADDRPN